MMTSLGVEIDSETSDDEWVITSLQNQTEKQKTKQTKSISFMKTPKHTSQTRISKTIKQEFNPQHHVNNQTSSSSSSINLSPTAAHLSPPSSLHTFPSLDSPQSPESPLQYLSEEELEDICRTMDTKRLVCQLVDVYKSAEIFTKIREIETDSMSFEMRLRDQLESCQDPCTFIVDSLDALSVYFSTHAKIRELTPKFRRMLVEMLCKGLSQFLDTPSDERRDKVKEEPDLISFKEDDIPSAQEADLISFDDTELLVQLSDNDTENSESEESSDDDLIPVITFAEPAKDKYTITRAHQDRLIKLIDTIPSPVVVYYALDTFRLGQLIAHQCEHEEEGVRLTWRLLKYGYFTETVNNIKKLDLFSHFPIVSFANQMFTAGQGSLLPPLLSQRPHLQEELMQFIEKQLRFNFAGALGIVPPERLIGMDTDTTVQLSRLKERKFQKDLVMCGVKVAQDMKRNLSDYYFIQLSQRYACLRWILAQRAIQQTEDYDMSIKKSSNYNGLVDYVCGNDSALARLTIKELVDMGDMVAPAYFATHYKEEAFFCRYNSLSLSERLIGIVRGEQISRHWSSLVPKKPSNLNKLPYYELPSNVSWLLVNSEKSLILMKDVLSRSHLCGIDTEWVPAFAASNSVKTALMQIASDISSCVFLLDLKTISSSNNPLLFRLTEKILQFLFEDEEILKIAYDFTGDFQLLCQSIPSLKSWDVVKMMDLKTITSPPTSNAVNGLPITGGLSGVVGTYLGCALNKRQQISNWEKRPLTEDQAIYAASDAYCLLQIYEVLCKLKHPFLKKFNSCSRKEPILQ